MEPVAPPPTDTRIDPNLEVDVADRSVSLSRWFDAPRDRVWRAWTDPEQLAVWWGPHGYTNPTARTEPRTGGELHIVMRSPDGIEYPMHGEFLEVDRPSRLVFTDVVADDMPAAWHEQLDSLRSDDRHDSALRMVVTVTFEERDGGTQLTVATAFASNEDRDAVMRMGAVSGWSESMEKLETLLAAA